MTSGRADADGLVLVSGLEIPMASVEAEHPEQAPQRIRGLVAPTGG